MEEERLLALLEALDVRGQGLDLARMAELMRITSLWSQRLNLTGASDPDSLVEVLFADALMLARERVIARSARVLDVGAGAGAPTLPLLLVRPDLEATLLEPRQKRVAFMRTLVGSLDLIDRATLVTGRLPETPLPDAPYDVALSRATFEPAEWLARAEGLAPRTLVLSSGEIPSAAGRRLVDAVHYHLPSSGSSRVIAIYE